MKMLAVLIVSLALGLGAGFIYKAINANLMAQATATFELAK